MPLVYVFFFSKKRYYESVCIFWYLHYEDISQHSYHLHFINLVSPCYSLDFLLLLSISLIHPSRPMLIFKFISFKFLTCIFRFCKQYCGCENFKHLTAINVRWQLFFEVYQTVCHSPNYIKKLVVNFKSLIIYTLAKLLWCNWIWIRVRHKIIFSYQ